MDFTHLLYLHGFRSSPNSAKARRMAEWAATQAGLTFACPQLPPSPLEAMALVAGLVADWPASGAAVIGSSLGGFYATALAEQPAHRGWRVAVLNPAVDPARDLARHIGTLTAWHDPELKFEFTAQHVAELAALAPPARLTHPLRYYALIAKGDELLDWREMLARYAGCDGEVLEGSDHGLTDFEDHLPGLLRHLQA
ncbi:MULTISPECIES: YqiA/YcfP family alpha/beta fold hydrolase [unclassified Roseateles]|uniref:YqiA/YcfP family alpha/beta fold hydrolase n=1 Tax=unclassified Roseateles TaxID=2626991 RepID=UPI0006FB20AF|nr:MULTISPECIES: YqiA/YcfP family alpha/beta fold hydrolase [unclassified Roseateles]KQW51788.1 esterase [Pelomonas sp. Root405]KRA78021.1 esterase [Pelomonas sp. Root662]